MPQLLGGNIWQLFKTLNAHSPPFPAHCLVAIDPGERVSDPGAHAQKPAGQRGATSCSHRRGSIAKPLRWGEEAVHADTDPTPRSPEFRLGRLRGWRQGVAGKGSGRPLAVVEARVCLETWVSQVSPSVRTQRGVVPMWTFCHI